MVETDADYSNIAIQLREITANSDKVTGSILRKVNKAAKDGKYHIDVFVSEDEYKYLSAKQNNWNVPDIVPPLVEKLWSLGFKLTAHNNVGFFGDKFSITIYW